jgi:Flp pilus assembly protein TadB
MPSFLDEIWAAVSGGRAAAVAAFEQQLPHALELLGDELIAGRSLVDALDQAAEALDEPARSAFQRLFVSTAARGGTESLASLFTTLGAEQRSPLLQEVAATIAILEPLGGNLSRVLYDIAEHVRRAREVEQRVRDAQWVRRRDAFGVLGMAVALIFLLMFIPSMRSLVFDSTAGRVSFALGLGLITVSLVLVWNIIRPQPEIRTAAARAGAPIEEAPAVLDGALPAPPARRVPARAGARENDLALPYGMSLGEDGD